MKQGATGGLDVTQVKGDQRGAGGRGCSRGLGEQASRKYRSPGAFRGVGPQGEGRGVGPKSGRSRCPTKVAIVAGPSGVMRPRVARPPADPGVDEGGGAQQRTTHWNPAVLKGAEILIHLNIASWGFQGIHHLVASTHR